MYAEGIWREDTKIVVNGEFLEQVDEFVVLGRMFRRNGKTVYKDSDAGNAVNGELNAVIANKKLPREVKLAVHNKPCMSYYEWEDH